MPQITTQYNSASDQNMLPKELWQTRQKLIDLFGFPQYIDISQIGSLIIFSFSIFILLSSNVNVLSLY